MIDWGLIHFMSKILKMENWFWAYQLKSVAPSSLFKIDAYTQIQLKVCIHDKMLDSYSSNEPNLKNQLGNYKFTT